MARKVELKTIFALDALHIPGNMQDVCLDIDDEFPLHYSNGIVRICDNGNPFSEWLKTIGFKFHNKSKYDEHAWNWLAVWGT